MGGELPLRKDFVAPSDGYLKHCVMSMIEDISSTLNFKVVGCCHWHANMSLLFRWLEDLQSSPCRSEPEVLDAWQCEACSAIISAREDCSQCWICCSPNG